MRAWSFQFKTPQIHLPFICHLLWHLKLNLYAFLRMPYLIVFIIQNCILHLTPKKESICICYPCFQVLISKWYFHKWSLKVFYSAIQKCLFRKGWVPKAMTQDILDMEKEKEKPNFFHWYLTIQPQYICFFFSILTGTHRCLFNSRKTEILNMETKDHIASDIRVIYNSFH